MTKLLNYLNGAKTYLGLFLAVVYAGSVSQGLIDQNASFEAVIEIVLGVGLGHKVLKTLG